MSTTFYGTLDSVPVNLFVQPGQAYPTDRQGTLVEIDALPSGATIDNIFFFDSPTAGKFLQRVITGPVRAAECGLYPTNTAAVNSARLIAAFGSPNNIPEIVFDFTDPTDIPLEGTITIPAGRMLTFRNGNRLAGTFTLQGGIINAGYKQHIFPYTATIKPEGMTTPCFSAMWMGAVGDGDVSKASANYLALQKAIDTVIYSQQATNGHLFIPNGKYWINKGLLVWNDQNGDGVPDYINIRISGSLSAYRDDRPETMIACTHTDNFGLAIMRGKGCIVENLFIWGQNQLNYDQATAWDPATTYLRSGYTFRTNTQSPFAGLVLDPISSATTGSNRYEGFESYYANATGTSGSTDCKILNVRIDGFVVGIILTPQIGTQNNESHLFDNIWIENCRDGFVTTNSQERAVTCARFKSWESVQTLFRTTGYGNNRGDIPIIDTVSTAKNIFQLFYFSGVGGYFAVARITNLQVESTRRIGIVGAQTIEITNSMFKFSNPDDDSLTYPNWIIQAGRVKFTNCVMVWYGGEEQGPMNFSASTTNSLIVMENCMVGNIPSLTSTGGWTLDDHGLIVKDCFFHTGTDAGKITNDHIMGRFNQYQYYGTSGGDRETIGYGKELITQTYLASDTIQPFKNCFQRRRIKSPMVQRLFLGDTTITVAANKLTATFTGNSGYQQYVGKLLFAKNISIAGMQQAQIGRISAFDAATNTVTINKLIEGLVTGTYELYVQQYQTVGVVSIGTVTSGSTTVTNIVSETTTSGNVVAASQLQYVDGFLTMVLSTSGSSATLHRAAPNSQSRAIICRYEYDEDGACRNNPLSETFFSNGMLFTKGAFYKNIDSNVNADILGWMCTRSGVKGSAIPPEFVQITNGITEITRTISTADATPTTIATIAIPTAEVWEIDATIICNQSPGSAFGKFRKTITAGNISGTVAIIGALDTIGVDSPYLTSTVGAGTSAGNLLLRVMGVAATDMRWTVVYRIRKHLIPA